jgi:hypothetical protein
MSPVACPPYGDSIGISTDCTPIASVARNERSDMRSSQPAYRSAHAGYASGLHAIEPVTRVSSRGEFTDVEFNGTAARSPYIGHQGIRIGCCKQIARSPDSTLALRSVINSSRPLRVCNRSNQEKRK